MLAPHFLFLSGSGLWWSRETGVSFISEGVRAGPLPVLSWAWCLHWEHWCRQELSGVTGEGTETQSRPSPEKERQSGLHWILGWAFCWKPGLRVHAAGILTLATPNALFHCLGFPFSHRKSLPAETENIYWMESITHLGQRKKQEPFY